MLNSTKKKVFTVFTVTSTGFSKTLIYNVVLAVVVDLIG